MLDIAFGELFDGNFGEMFAQLAEDTTDKQRYPDGGCICISMRNGALIKGQLVEVYNAYLIITQSDGTNVYVALDAIDFAYTEPVGTVVSNAEVAAFAPVSQG